LHLNYYGLKQRVEVLPAALPSADPAEPGRLRPAFVELGVPPSVLGGAATLEVEDRTGRKLTVRLAREDSRELLALARAVWGCAP
jgi:hypothetical protein